MTQRKGKTIGKMPASALEKLGVLEVCRSANERAKFPVYLRTPFGPITFNNVQGQDFILENAELPGAEPQAGPEPAPQEKPEPTTNTDPEEPQEKKRGALDWLFGDDDDE